MDMKSMAIGTCELEKIYLPVSFENVREKAKKKKSVFFNRFSYFKIFKNELII